MAAFDYADAAFATPLIRAVISCNREEVRRALKQGYNPNLADNRGWTSLHEAAIQDERSPCLKELLAHSSSDSINKQTFLGETPLFLACENGNIKGVELLLKKSRCKVNLENSEGVSPLHIACSKGNVDAVKLLVKFGARVNIQDFNGYTPLHEAVSFISGTREVRDQVSFMICQILLKYGGKTDIAEFEGNYPFHLACQNGFLKCVDLLYSSTKNSRLINLGNNDRRTPLMMGVQSKNLSMVEKLLTLGADPNIADKSDVIALHLAAHNANFEIFNTIHKATSSERISKHCIFDEEKDFERILKNKSINSIICLAIDTEDLNFLVKVLESDFDPAVLQCPVVHAENFKKRSFTLHTPVSFLLESKMFELGERTLEFLQVLINYQSPLKVTSRELLINYINPICAALVALNDCPKTLVLECLKVLLCHGADPDEPYGRMPFAMEQACMRNCCEAVLLLLHYSNVLEPDDVLKWIEIETSSNQEKIVEALLPLAPYYKASNKLLTDALYDLPTKKLLVTQQVHPLSSYCRSAIRKQIHMETKLTPTLFRQKLLSLDLPKSLQMFLLYGEV